MKKRFLVPLALILVATMLAGCSTTISFTNSVGDVKYAVVDDHAEVVALPNGSDDTDIVIEDEYEGKPVTVIKDFVGCNLESAQTIHIGKNINQIGKWVLTNNQRLEAFEIDEQNEAYCSVDGAIYSKDMTILHAYPCAGKTEYVMPDTVETVDARAFYKNFNLKKITLSKNLKTIKEMAFFQCEAVESIDFPDTLKFIGKDAFSKCTSLTELTIPSSIEEITEYAFYNCTNVKKVDVKRKKDEIKLGTKWQPTDNGIKLDDLQITFAE